MAERDTALSRRAQAVTGRKCRETNLLEYISPGDNSKFWLVGCFQVTTRDFGCKEATYGHMCCDIPCA